MNGNYGTFLLQVNLANTSEHCEFYRTLKSFIGTWKELSQMKN